MGCGASNEACCQSSNINYKPMSNGLNLRRFNSQQQKDLQQQQQMSNPLMQQGHYLDGTMRNSALHQVNQIHEMYENSTENDHRISIAQQ
eukprot:403376749